MASTASCGTACEVGYGNTCLCSTTPTNTQAYDITDVNIESTISNVLFIGALSNLIQDSTMYTKCISMECQAIAGTTSSGIHAIWYKKTAEGSVGSMDIDTIFEIISTIAGNEHLFLYNRLSTVSVGLKSSLTSNFLFEFRNPPHFMPMFGERDTKRSGFPSSFDKPQATYETNALIRYLFEHANTAPFVSHRLIQRMVTSNPSPRYVDVVATAFRTGSYNGITYSGKYGCLKATTMAILLDREARASVLDSVPAFGKLREPLLKVLHTFRALEYVPMRGRDVFFARMQKLVGQAAFRAPSVFSFFLPEYQPPGTILDNNLVAPEAELGTAPLLMGFLNGMTSMINYGLTSCLNGFGGFASYPKRKCLTSLLNNPNIYNTNDGTLTYSSNYNVDWIVHELNTLLTSGRMNEETLLAIKKQYNTIVTSASRSGQNLIKYGPGNTKKDALKSVIKLFMLSSEFHATSLNTYTKTLRPNPVPVASSGRPYKAVVVLFLAGAADSFNMLVPTTGCGTHDLYQEYKTIRSNAALDTSELLDITVTKGTIQPCTNFGVHKKLQVVKDSWELGEASWMANMGVLTQPTTRQQFKDKTVPLPPSLFAHNIMQRSISTMHPQMSNSKGVLGRIMDTMMSRKSKYISFLFNSST